MTRKHFEAIALTLANLRPKSSRAERKSMNKRAERLIADFLAAQVLGPLEGRNQRVKAVVVSALRAAESDALSANEQWLKTIEKMADTLSAQNGQFDRGRFLAACGYNG